MNLNHLFTFYRSTTQHYELTQEALSKSIDETDNTESEENYTNHLIYNLRGHIRKREFLKNEKNLVRFTKEELDLWMKEDGSQIYDIPDNGFEYTFFENMLKHLPVFLNNTLSLSWPREAPESGLR
jgi:hypothetical protein